MSKSNITKQPTKRWTEIAQLIYDYGGKSIYDDPMEAMRLGTIIGHSYPGRAAWEKWMHEHYVGEAGYDHETGKITHLKLREFFDRYYPDFEEQQRKRAAQQDET